MFRSGTRFMSRSLPLIAMTLAFQGCGDDTGPKTPEAVTTEPVADELAAIRAGVITGDQVQDNFLELSEVIACAMANNTGLCTGLGEQSPAFGGNSAVDEGREADWALKAANGEVLSLISSSPMSLAALASPMPVEGLFLAAPFEVTCVWGFANGFWVRDATDPYGTVPERTTRFELSVAQGGEPVEPLVSLGNFVDVWNGAQQTTDNSVNVRLYTDPGVFPSINFPLQGTSVEGQVLNLVSNGGSIDTGVDVMDFGLSFTNTSFLVEASVRGYSISEQTQGDFSGLRQTDLLVEKADGPARSVLYSFEWSFSPSSNFPISSGEVTVDGHVVATISGSELGPIFTLTDDSRLDPSERFDLTSIWIDARGFRDRILDLYSIGHCIGADREGECSVMKSRLGGIS